MSHSFSVSEAHGRIALCLVKRGWENCVRLRYSRKGYSVECLDYATGEWWPVSVDPAPIQDQIYFVKESLSFNGYLQVEV